MKKITLLLASLIVFAMLLFVACERDYPVPIDVFEEEVLDDPYQIPTSDIANGNELFVNNDRIRPTDDGYHIKGTVFANSKSGLISVTSGDFYVDIDNTTSKSNAMSIDGYGTFEFPQAGIMQHFDPETAQGSFVYYNTGSFFKSQEGKDDYPITDDFYYFHYEKDTSKSDKSGTSSKDSTRTRKMKNSKFKFREFYMDVSDPQVFILGDYETKTNVYKDLWMGFSANHLFEFDPYHYSDRLDEVAGGMGFYPMNGNFYMAGKIPIKKYQVKIDGKSTINTDFGTGGELDFFENCLEEGQFQMSANGDLYADSKLISIFKKEYKLAKGTLQAEFSSSGAALRMAGEYNNNYLKDILGDQASKYLGSMENEGRMYIRLSDDIDDFLVFVEQGFSLNVLNFGDLKCMESVVKCTKDEFEIHGIVNLPYNIGDVEVVGLVESNGNFSLKGSTQVQLQLTSDLSFESDIDLTISQDGISIMGNLDLPYGIGNIDVEGNLTKDGILLKGTVDSHVIVTEGLSLPISLQAIFDSNMGASFSGSAVLPFGVASIEVLGELHYDHLLLEGQFAGQLEFLNTDLLSTHFGAKILVSDNISESGIFLNGGLTLPQGFGYVDVEGEISANDLFLQGHFHGEIPFNDLLAVDLTVSSSVRDGITFLGNLDINCIASASASIYGHIYWNDVYLEGRFAAGVNINVCGIDVDAGGDLTVKAGLNYGVELTGGVKFPFGLGDARLSASLQRNGTLAASGRFTSGVKIRDITLPVFDLRFNGSSNSGLSVSGAVDVGFGIGKINLASGSISRSGFRFVGGDSDMFSLNFGITKVDFGCEVTISNNDMGFDFSVVSASVDWDDHSIEVCCLGICLGLP
jgi:hypothetical protein